MMFKVFIDGGEGTTGLRLAQRLKQREDIELLSISSDLRKNLDARLEKIDQADVAFLCLPDTASREVAEAAKDCETKIIDTSTAFMPSRKAAGSPIRAAMPLAPLPSWLPW